IDDVPLLVVGPAVVGAAEAVALGDAIRERDAPVRAALCDEAELPGLVAVEHEVLAEEPHRADRILVEVSGRCDGVPVPAQEGADWRTRSDARKPLVLFLCQHLHAPRFARSGSLNHGRRRSVNGRLCGASFQVYAQTGP